MSFPNLQSSSILHTNKNLTDYKEDTLVSQTNKHGCVIHDSICIFFLKIYDQTLWISHTTSSVSQLVKKLKMLIVFIIIGCDKWLQWFYVSSAMCLSVLKIFEINSMCGINGMQYDMTDKQITENNCLAESDLHDLWWPHRIAKQRE